MSLWPYSLSLAAGALTTLSPCVLSALPLVVGSSIQEHRHGPLAMAAGMIASFTLLAVSLAAAGSILGLEQTQIRSAAAAAMIAFGAAMGSSRWQEKLAAAGSPLAGAADRFLRRAALSGLKGQFLLGALLGAVWTPCAGPTLGAALGLASETGQALPAAAMMALFGAGAAAPLLALGYGARRLLLSRREALARHAGTARAAFGAVFLTLGLTVLTGADKAFDSTLVSWMPSWLIDLTTRF